MDLGNVPPQTGTVTAVLIGLYIATRDLILPYIKSRRDNGGNDSKETYGPTILYNALVDNTRATNHLREDIHALTHRVERLVDKLEPLTK